MHLRAKAGFSPAPPKRVFFAPTFAVREVPTGFGPSGLPFAPPANGNAGRCCDFLARPAEARFYRSLASVSMAAAASVGSPSSCVTEK